MRGVYAFARKDCGRASTYPDEVDFDAAFLSQSFSLRFELRNELTPHCANSAEEKIEFFAIAHEETIVQHAYCFAQLRLRNDERHTQFERTQGDGIDPNTISSQHGEKSTYCACVVAEVLSHNRYCCQIIVALCVIHSTSFNLISKFAVKDGTSLRSLGRGDCERSGCFGSGLCHHKHAHSSLRKTREDALIHPYNTYHRHTAHRDECCLTDGGNAANEAISRCSFLANHRVASGGVERVAHKDGNTGLAHGENGGWINDFCSEITQFCGFFVGEFVDGESRWNHSWIGSHKSINICPNFQNLCSECSRNDGSRVVRTSSSEISGVSCLCITSYESSHNCDLRQRVHILCNRCVGGSEIYGVACAFSACFDDFLCINVDGFVDGACHNR